MTGNERPTRSEFALLARHFDVVPVVRELLLDLDTPVSSYRKLARGRAGFLLESVEGGENWGRYSVLGAGPAGRLRARGDEVEIEWEGRRRRRRVADPLRALEAWLGSMRAAPVAGLPRFYGGAVGRIDFEVVRRMQRMPGLDPLPASDRWEVDLQLVTDLVVFDNLAHTAQLVSCARVTDGAAGQYDAARRRLDVMQEALVRPCPEGERRTGSSRAEWSSDRTAKEFGRSVQKAREHIQAGDVFQVVLSHQMSRSIGTDSLDVYRALRCINPSPYMFYLDDGRAQVLGASPEVLVRAVDGRAEVRPIAGTRRRGGSAAEDQARIDDLLADQKERAEHVMLVDLGRNDLGRVCVPGSVRTTELMTIERYSHVLHLVSHVEGRMREGTTPFDALRATFPAGTVSGAPKVRALQVIDALERRRRGAYAGAVGYFGFGGAMDTCIAIRTLEIEQGTARLGVGAGIVLDSDPAREWEETMEKAHAARAAVEMAERGLVP